MTRYRIELLYIWRIDVFFGQGVQLAKWVVYCMVFAAFSAVEDCIMRI